MEKKMVKKKNMILKLDQNIKVNIKIEKEMIKVKNIMIMAN